MKKILLTFCAALCLLTLSVPAFAHGRGMRALAAQQCGNNGVCMVDGVCDGTCVRAGDCRYYDGCNSSCTGDRSCVNQGVCDGTHSRIGRGCHSGGGYGRCR